MEYSWRTSSPSVINSAGDRDVKDVHQSCMQFIINEEVTFKTEQVHLEKLASNDLSYD
ncbi:unnamed protein product, partial [Nesidiocoris tenuis]